MSSAWLQVKRGFASFLGIVWSRIRDSGAAASALEAGSGKIAEWASSLMVFYFTSAIGIAVVSVQVKNELPLVFHSLYLFILLGFYSLLLAEFVRFKPTYPNHLLRYLDLFFLTLSFAHAVSIPFPLYFKFLSFVLFLSAVSLMSWFATISTT